MADSQQPQQANASPDDQDWNKREPFGRALRDILIAGVILAGGLYFYYHRSQVKKAVWEDGKAARDLLAKGNPKDLLSAREKFAAALALDANDAFSTSSTALIETLLWQEYGVVGEKSASDEWTQKAQDHGGNLDERFSAEALNLLGNGKVTEAADLLKGVVDRNGAGPGLADALGQARRAQLKLDESRALLKKAHDLGWRTPRYADDLADSYFDDGDAVNAEGFYAKGIESNSEHLRSQVGQARARIARGLNLKQAADALDAVLAKPAAELAPNLKAAALTGQAELRRFEQKYDEALKLADEAITTQPNFAWAYAVKGSVLSFKNDAAAGASLEKAISLDKAVGAFYFEAARSEARLKNGAKAEEFLAGYAKILKVDDRYHVVYGDLMRDLSNSPKAISEYQEAIKANALNAAAHYNLGVLLTPTDVDNAVKEFGFALAAQSTYPDAHQRLGDIWYSKKKLEDSLQEYARALVDMKTAGMPREKIDGLLDEVNAKLLKDKEKDTAKLWMEQGRQLVR